jgi:hypothetical protein
MSHLMRRGEYLSGGRFFPSPEYAEEDFTTFGVPIEAQLSLIPAPFVGIGITGFASLGVCRLGNGNLRITEQ